MQIYFSKNFFLFRQEIETALKKKELELRLTEASLKESHGLLHERTELIKQERQVVSFCYQVFFCI